MPYEFDLTPLITALSKQPQFQGTKYPPMSPNSIPGGMGLMNQPPGPRPVPGLQPPRGPQPGLSKSTFRGGTL